MSQSWLYYSWYSFLGIASGSIYPYPVSMSDTLVYYGGNTHAVVFYHTN